MGQHAPKLGRGTRLFITIFIGIQILIPAWQLGSRWVHEGSQPTSEYILSWQMYSAANSGDYVGITASGQRVSLSIDDLPPVLRMIGYDSSVPSALCDQVDGLESVQRVNAGTMLASHLEPVTC